MCLCVFMIVSVAWMMFERFKWLGMICELFWGRSSILPKMSIRQNHLNRLHVWLIFLIEWTTALLSSFAVILFPCEHTTLPWYFCKIVYFSYYSFLNEFRTIHYKIQSKNVLFTILLNKCRSLKTFFENWNVLHPWPVPIH